MKIPILMEELGASLTQATSSVETSAEIAIAAQLRLVSIHPFTDDNGRTARLLMNLLLMRAGYPQLVIRPEDPIDYLDSIEASQLHEKTTEYQSFVLGRLSASLDDYLQFLMPEK